MGWLFKGDHFWETRFVATGRRLAASFHSAETLTDRRRRLPISVRGGLN